MQNKKQIFMETRGLFDSSTPEYAQAEKEYNRLYQKEWAKSNKDNYKVVKVAFHIKDYEKITLITVPKKIPTARFIRESALASCKGSYYTPPPELLPKAITAINHVGNLINTHTRYIHTNRFLTMQDYQDMLDHIKTLRESLKNIYYHDL